MERYFKAVSSKIRKSIEKSVLQQIKETCGRKVKVKIEKEKISFTKTKIESYKKEKKIEKMIKASLLF